LQHEWLNARGAIPRFSRNAIEIRMIDVQECPQADLAIAAAVVAVVRTLYGAPLAAQRAVATETLTAIMQDCILDAEQAVIEDAEYLGLLGFPGSRCEARALWRHLVETKLGDAPEWQEPLRLILEQGPLARRILRTIGADCDRERLEAVYRALCDCLEQGRLFSVDHA